MILPAALALGAQLMMPVVTDGVPQLNVEQVCEGIAKQGGVDDGGGHVDCSSLSCGAAKVYP